MKVKLFVQSCDSRQWIWEHWWKCYERMNFNFPVVFITEEKTVDLPVETFKTGKVPFTTGLLDALKNYEEQILIYTLDDYFMIREMPMNSWINMVRVNLWDCLRLQPWVTMKEKTYNMVEEKSGLLRMVFDSAYQVSFATSIWRRDFFRECLIPGMDPWTAEVHNNANELWPHRIYYINDLPRWYVNGTLKGVLTEEGKKAIK